MGAHRNMRALFLWLLDKEMFWFRLMMELEIQKVRGPTSNYNPESSLCYFLYVHLSSNLQPKYKGLFST